MKSTEWPFVTIASMRDKEGYIPTLDGWRAVAITGVFFAHSKMPLIPVLGYRVNSYLQYFGGNGVELFFAISGLLICTRLLEEESRRGQISLRGFYIRRAFRILPPAFLYLFFVGFLSVAGLLVVSKLDWLASAFFFRNYTLRFYPPVMDWWFTSHFWSLSVEEHFYFILPGLLFFLRKWRLRVLAVIAILVKLWTWVALHPLHLNMETVSLHTELQLDNLLIPAMVAIWVRRGNHQQWMRRLLPAWSSPILIGLYVYLLQYYPRWPQTSLCAAMLLLSTIYHPRWLLGRILEWAPIRWVGRLSYSLYLWQMFFCCGRYAEAAPFPRLQSAPLNFVLLFACAIASFYLVERPMIRLGHRLAKPVTPGHEDVAIAT